MKVKGFTLIELLAVIVILAIIALIATPLILNVIDDSKKGALKSTAYGIMDAAELNYVDDVIENNKKEVSYVYKDSNEVSTSNKNLQYKGQKPNAGVVLVDDKGKIAINLHDGKYCVSKDYDETEVTISEKTEAECTPYNYNQNVNRPVLVKGMQPIKWNSVTNSWVNTDVNDPEWYDYSQGAKKWANVKTADGSFWVWIPRYAYQIASGYHSSTTGQINIKFLINNTNTTIDGTKIEKIPTYQGDKQLNYIVHPAFTFGDDEVNGIWVAKFRVSGTLSAIESKPGVQSLRSVTVGNFFTASRNMETNNRYGWGTDGKGFDTHFMKNTEWGAIAYLTHSDYGNDHEVWLNNSSKYYTGCSSGAVDAAPNDSNGCQYQYYEANGVGASSTGNVYGIYDLSTFSPEYMAAYYNNTSSSVQNGASIISAGPKYYNVYTASSPENLTQNYENAKEVIGDAVYETSGCISGYCGWNGDYVYIPGGSNPWFHRTGLQYYGLFYFGWSSGGAWDSNGFRVVIIPGKNL